ncbi:PIN domain-containing protein [hot springs metagenome]|uniref:PIN domain-containing protein n=1 Tax=hot springs metagenome TaxID=433727 RepID=A0A5J4KXU5_9ZZZZ
MKTVFVDTNIFLRYLTADDPIKYEKCRELFNRAVNGKVSLLTSEMVIAELIWTLQSFYKVAKDEIIEKITVVISTPNLIIPNSGIIAEALIIYSRKNIDYIDAYNSVFMKHHSTSNIYSYDSDFDTIGGIKRIEP